jgi:hypothetical protein
VDVTAVGVVTGVVVAGVVVAGRSAACPRGYAEKRPLPDDGAYRAG